MAVVRVTAPIPGRRIRLVRMLTAAGHRVLSADDHAEPGVWVLDHDALVPLDAALGAGWPAFALIVLSDDARSFAGLSLSPSPGWALLPRDADAVDLDLAVRAVEAGLIVLGHHPRAFSPTSGKACKQTIRLTVREEDVLQLIAEGLPNKAIARALNVSENTVKFHVSSICAKLDARSRTEAVTVAARNGLLLL